MIPVEESTENPTSQQPTPREGLTGKSEISSELVRKVADKVYTMLIAELTLENERNRMFRKYSGGR